MDMICRKTMMRCQTPNMCAPFQGCSVPQEQRKKSGFFDLPRQEFCTHQEHNAPNGIYVPPGKGYRHVCPGCGREQVIIPTQITM
ncbi:hypothetical protein CAL14_05340 [Bordetella genomosp. 9]|nr:hypothetical protein CAL14_05340 [Bordetella genomosp. 9]